MGTDPLFPTAAFLPLTDAAHAPAMTKVSMTYSNDIATVDDFSGYHNEMEAA
jgi:hypothetical protein